MLNTLRLLVSIAFLCLSVCLSKSLHVFVFQSLPLSKHMWCSSSRPGFTISIPGISSPVPDKPPPHSCIGLNPVFSPTMHNKIFTQADIIAISELSEVGTVKPVEPYQN